MPTFKLTQGEIQEVLDAVHPDAYDKLQGALERKVCTVLAERKWLDIWEGGDWNIEMTLKFELIKEEEND